MSTIKYWAVVLLEVLMESRKDRARRFLAGRY